MNRRAQFKFRLYVANHAENSTKAIANLAAICREYLADRYEIEIIDVYKDPKRALVDGVLMTPTLIRVSPLPVRRIVGTLSDTQRVLDALELQPAAA